MQIKWYSNLIHSRYRWVATLFLGWCSMNLRCMFNYNSSLSIELGTQQQFKKPVRILCWVPITSTAEKSKINAKRIQKTWGKRCDILLFMGSQTDESVPSIGLPVEESFDTLWGKTHEALKYIYDHHFFEVDWIFKADDDTYVVMENLRKFISSYDHSLPHFLGTRFSHNRLIRGYLGGGAGYAMSKETLRIFIEHGYNNEFDMCISGHKGEEDTFLAMCLEVMGVLMDDTRDSNGGERFLQLTLNNLYKPLEYKELLRAFFPSSLGPGCCSNKTISFHPVVDEQLLEFEYLIYHYRQLVAY